MDRQPQLPGRSQHPEVVKLEKKLEAVGEQLLYYWSMQEDLTKSMRKCEKKYCAGMKKHSAFKKKVENISMFSEPEQIRIRKRLSDLEMIDKKQLDLINDLEKMSIDVGNEYLKDSELQSKVAKQLFEAKRRTNTLEPIDEIMMPIAGLGHKMAQNLGGMMNVLKKPRPSTSGVSGRMKKKVIFQTDESGTSKIVVGKEEFKPNNDPPQEQIADIRQINTQLRLAALTQDTGDPEVFDKVLDRLINSGIDMGAVQGYLNSIVNDKVKFDELCSMMAEQSQSPEMDEFFSNWSSPKPGPSKK